MAYAFKVARVTISGSVFANTEQWSTGFFLGFDDGDVGPITTGVAEAINSAWAGFYTTAANSISSSCFTRQVKVAMLNTDGTTDLGNIDYYIAPSPYAGGGAGTMFPAQIATVATLTSGHPRGLASKGRMYLPGVNGAVDSTTGKMATALQNSLATTLETFFEAIPGLTGIPGKPILASDVASPKVPRNARITGLRVGSVYDTQRRRRNGLTEGYVTRVVTNP